VFVHESLSFDGSITDVEAFSVGECGPHRYWDGASVHAATITFSGEVTAVTELF
jgi:hypothetical protein